MKKQEYAPIKNWIKSMGFELVNSHSLKNMLINYYHLGNFGVYEEVLKQEGTSPEADLIFVSWNPWGEVFEVNTVNDLSRAYAETLTISPQLSQ